MSNHSEKPKRGRPPTYKFNKPDSELSENEKRLKDSVMKRRMRQNRSYHEKKKLRQLEKQKLLTSSSSSRSLPPSSSSSSSSSSWAPAPQQWTPPPPMSLSSGYNIVDNRLHIPEELLRLGQLVHDDLTRVQGGSSVFFQEPGHNHK